MKIGKLQNFSQFFPSNAYAVQQAIQVAFLNYLNLIYGLPPLYNSQFVIYWMSWQANFPYNTDYSFVQVPIFFLAFPYEAPQTAKEPQLSLEANTKKQSVFVDLSKDDLLNAGYEVKKKSWSEEEDKLLMKVCYREDLNWEQIAKLIPNRSAKMCYSRYRRLEQKLKNQWTQSENRQIMRLVSLYGLNWRQISDYLPKRSAKQIEEHYMNCLSPEINKDPWTIEQDVELIELLKSYGRDWVQISKHMNGRTQNQIKNRYFGRIKRLEDKKNQEKRKIKQTKSNSN